jgi:selenide,water dikinase
MRQLVRVVHAIGSLAVPAAVPGFAQPLVKSAIQVDPGNTKQAGQTFAYRLTYNCSSTSGPCLNAEVVDLLPAELAAEVLRGGLEVAQTAGCHVGGGHSIDDPEPKYGLSVTGVADPSRLLRNDAGVAGMPLTLTKPLGVGVLNNRHKATGEVFPEAVACMTALNREASRTALAAGLVCATDVTGFGLLGHLLKLCRASRVAAVVESAAVPYLSGARESLAGGYVPGGSRRNLDWVRPSLSADVDDDELVLLADAQTSGGLLVAGELPGHPVVGQLVEHRPGEPLIRVV